MELTFIVALAAMALLWVTLWKLELTAKALSFRLRSLSRHLDEELTLDRAGEPKPSISPLVRAPLPTIPARSV